MDTHAMVFDNRAARVPTHQCQRSRQATDNKEINMTFTSEIASLVESQSVVFTELADTIWDHPQLAWNEFDAVQQQIKLAEKYGFQVTRNLAGIPTAFYAEFGESGPVIAFLGEYDSLAGLSQQSGAATPIADPANTSSNGQGCGHHLLGAGSLLAAVATASYLDEKGINGRVRYYGCPAEESGSGKTFMVKAGAFDNVDAAVTWHPDTTLRTRQGLINATMDVYFTFHGIAAHASSAHNGRSALDAVELMNVGVNFLREHMTESCRVHYAITDAGGRSSNVVQAQATVYYTVRARTVAETRELYTRVVKIAEGAALMTETTLDIEFDGGSAEVLPNEILETALHRHAESFGGVPFDEHDQQTARMFTALAPVADVASVKQSVGIPADDPRSLHDEVPPLDAASPRPRSFGSSDVGDVSWVTPTVQLWAAPCLSFGAPAHSWLWVAQGKLPAAHKGMVYAAKVMAATAADLFTDPALLARARAEFTAATEHAPYDCPIPDGVVPPPARPGQHPIS